MFDEAALVETIRRIAAANLAGGWRKLDRS